MRFIANNLGKSLYLTVYSDEYETKLNTRISSLNTYKVELPIVNEVHNIVMEVGRFNGLSDTEIVKNFVENMLSEKEQRELIKSLEN